MKTILIIPAALAAAIFLNPVSFAGNKKNASATPPCKSCRKAADPGKKNSTIKSSQKTGAVLFDGVDPNLSAKDFAPDSYNPSALTGGGRLLDLKASEPDLSKVSPLTDFNLDKPTTLVFAKTALLPQKAEAASNPAGFICSTASIRCADLNLLETITIPRAEEALAKAKEALIIAEQACERDPKLCVFVPSYEQNVAGAREVLQCAQVQRTAAKEKCGSSSWYTGSWFEKWSCSCYTQCVMPYAAIAGGGLLTCSVCFLLPVGTPYCIAGCSVFFIGVGIAGDNSCTNKCSGACN